jgi:YHS domain-containing protein
MADAKVNRVRDLEWRANGTVLADDQAKRNEFSVWRKFMTTDPVCGMKVNEANTEFQSRFAGKKYFFCSDECRKEFEDRPEEYVQIAA